MKILKTVLEMQKESDKLRKAGKKIGFVPTMGFLHKGHLSLIRIAKENCDICVASIFVNPAQFGPNEDLHKYPRDIERDEKLLKKEQTDILFYPGREDIYPDNYLTYVNVEKVSEIMCGEFRPVFFRGVATVVNKLFNIVKPHISVFGEKDFQQAAIIKKMVKDLNLDIKIITGPIVRDPDGLAMSSRNAYLSADERNGALAIYKSLCLAREAIMNGEKNVPYLKEKIRNVINGHMTMKFQYVFVGHPETLEDSGTVRFPLLIAIAAYSGETRLIDNIIIS